MRVHLVTVGQRHSMPRRLLERVARVAMRATRAPSWAELEVALVGDATMTRLNRRYHGRGGTTDVLTFPSAPGRGGPVLGEIVISLPQARDQARRYGHPIQHEVALLVTHGVLHLRGYDDRTRAGATRMQARAEAILQRVLRPRGRPSRRRAAGER